MKMNESPDPRFVSPSSRLEKPTAGLDFVLAAPAHLARGWWTWVNLGKIGLFVASLYLFVLAITLMKEGAGGLAPLTRTLAVTSPANSLGFGWLFAYTIMSGSPVAAAALTFFDAGVLDRLGAFAMITGSRLGASFIVLLVGFVSYLRGRQRVASISIGVLALLTTATIYLPATALGYLILVNGWFDDVRFGAPTALASAIDVVYDPIVHLLVSLLPGWLLFFAGLGILLLAFNIFDRALPEISPESSGFQRVSDLVYRPWVMFIIGMAVTAVTLSVSVSLTILVPLSARGYVRRENLIPYMMGANITTFIDTLLAALLLNTPRAFTIVFTEMTSVALLSLLALFINYNGYRRSIEWCLEWIMRDNRRLMVFLAIIFIVPVFLLLI